MSKYKYSYPKFEENVACAVGRDIGISFKQAIEITRNIRKKDLEKAQAYLQRVIDMKEAVKFTRFTNGLGHKPGMASGRYPKTACKHILMILNQAEANAQAKGLGRCKIIHISAQQADKPMHSGRRPRLAMKRAHVEVVLQEIEKKQDKKHKSKPAEPKQPTPIETKGEKK